MFERPSIGNRALLVNINFPEHAADDTLAEFKELALAAGAEIADIVGGQRSKPDPKYFIGSGKAQEIQSIVSASTADLVIFNHELSPSQERNLEKLLCCRVLDRTGLILDIFAQRARTFEGKLQVELAQLQHIATRLVRGWTHLERQRGGIGLRGPGETQLETDRRLIRKRIKTVGERLEKVRRQRAQGRRARQRSQLSAVSIVGYTNAGKSTVFNRLTAASVYVANQPFATLDPTLRRLELVKGTAIILADTVGFIRDLPHDLVDAFRATLEETREADLLLHVIDAQHDARAEQLAQVNEVLEQIDAQHVPQLIIYNKIDLLEGALPRLDRDAAGKPRRVWVSATTGAGFDLLQQALSELLEAKLLTSTVELSPQQARLRAQLYALHAVSAERILPDGHWSLDIQLHASDYARLFSENDPANLSNF